MAYGQDRASMEAHLAAAHRAVTRAKDCADHMSDEGAYLDLLQIEVELVRVAEGSLHAGKRKPLLVNRPGRLLP